MGKRVIDEYASRTHAVENGDALSSARTALGLERMEQIKFAILEKNGKIAFIPAEEKDL